MEYAGFLVPTSTDIEKLLYFYKEKSQSTLVETYSLLKKQENIIHVLPPEFIVL